MSSFLAVGSILVLQFQRFLCSFYSVQLVLSSSGIPMPMSNFCDGNQQHGPASGVVCSPPLQGGKWVADKNIWACLFRYIHRILFLGEGQKGISDPAKGRFFRTNIGDSLSNKHIKAWVSSSEFSINWTCDLSMCATVVYLIAAKCIKGYKGLKRHAE